MGERRGTKALELWCRRITDGYPGVSVQNMTTSWRDGLAFCAMIHHFRPDLIDFSSLNKDDIYGNNELAFRTAEQHLGIPALLDAEDMASCAVPDRLSILTYLSQFYQVFGGSSPSKLVLNRSAESPSERINSVPESPQPKVSSRLGMRREQCASCGLPVFLAEKLVVARSCYHRSCFRCARCRHQLTPGNYYETEDGQYCCEACPDLDEEPPPPPAVPPLQPPPGESLAGGALRTDTTTGNTGTKTTTTSSSSCFASAGVDLDDPDNAALLEAPLSDEEKSKRRSLEPTIGCNVEQLLRKQRNQLELVSSHLLGDRLEEPDRPDEPAADFSPPPPPLPQQQQSEPTSPAAKPESDEEKSARQQLQQRSLLLAGEDERDDEKFDEMIKLINERIDELTTEEPQSGQDVAANAQPAAQEEQQQEQEVDQPVSPDTRPRRDARINSAPDLADLKRAHIQQNQHKRANVQENAEVEAEAKEEEEKKRAKSQQQSRDASQERRGAVEPEEAAATSALRRSSSLRSPGEYTKEQQRRSTGAAADREQQLPRRLSLVQRRLRLFETEPQPHPVAAVASRSRSATPEPLARPLGSPRKTIESPKAKDQPQQQQQQEYPEELNPFASDEEQETTEPELPKRKQQQQPSLSTNPFGSISDEDEEELPPKPVARFRSSRGGSTGSASPTSPREASATRTKRVLEAPKISLNPFWSDDEEPDSGPESELELRNAAGGKSPPVPRPRTLRHSQLDNSYGNGSLQPKSNLTSSSIHSSNTSIASACSTMTQGGTYRKKKPAPPPPIPGLLGTPGRTNLNSSTASSTLSLSPRLTPRTRKSKPAPPPPNATSTPSTNNARRTSVPSPSVDEQRPSTPQQQPQPDNENRTSQARLRELEPKKLELEPEPADHEPKKPEPELKQHEQQQPQQQQLVWDEEKLSKDEANRTTQSLSTSYVESSGGGYLGGMDKSLDGKWKRKKGPAPSRPTPLRRKIKVMSMKDVKLELDQIEMQQQGLEKQGVRLEQIIRDKCESGDAGEDTSLGLDVEELVLELFALVNEKNELFRRQAELMLLRRQQRLEEEHADIEYQVRCLISQPEATKTDFDKQREEALIQRLVEIVERRNEIVECLEMDRRREIEEDRSIHREMDLYVARNKAESVNMTDESRRSAKQKKSKVKEKIKEKKSKKSSKKDADKDVDETESKQKRHTLRKWF